MISALCISAVFHALAIAIPALHMRNRMPAQVKTGAAAFDVRLVQSTKAAAVQIGITDNLKAARAIHAEEQAASSLVTSSPKPTREMDKASAAAIPELLPSQVTELLPQPPVFLDPTLLGNKPVPRSEPDFSSVVASVGNTPVLPITLRVFILDSGRVYRVQIIKAAKDDLWVAEKLAAAMRQTGFVAGQHNGIETAAWQDYEFSFLPPDLQKTASQDASKPSDRETASAN